MISLKDRQPRLKAGTKITCPKCSDIIGTVLLDILPGTTLFPSCFALYQKGHKVGQSMSCMKCGTPFARNVVHTEGGWV